MEENAMDPIVRLVHRSQELLMAGDVDGYVALFAENAVVFEPTGAVIEGRKHIGEHARQIISMLGRAEFLEQKVFVTGTNAAMRFTVRFQNGQGGHTMVEGVDVFEFDEQSRIRRVTSYYDPSVLSEPPGG
jgi:ketosteroid isomerase-like protein